MQGISVAVSYVKREALRYGIAMSHVLGVGIIGQHETENAPFVGFDLERDGGLWVRPRLNLLLHALHFMKLQQNSLVYGFLGSGIGETGHLRIMNNDAGSRVGKRADICRRNVLCHA